MVHLLIFTQALTASNTVTTHPPSPAGCEALVRAACVLEATACKPGNVHPGASFPDLEYADFVKSADAIAPVLGRTHALGVGPAIEAAIAATRAVTPRNTNLGIALLLAPLTAVPAERPLQDGIATVLRELTVADAEAVYRAIRLTRPGGMGRVPREDVSEAPTGTLREVMQLAANRDLIAAQYARDFELVLGTGLAYLTAAPRFADNWESAIIGLQLTLLARHPDSLIARKCGCEIAGEASRRAGAVLESGWPTSRTGQKSLDEFDGWLRGDGNRRNPGTTADLVAACLFAALREGRIAMPAWQSGESK